MSLLSKDTLQQNSSIHLDHGIKGELFSSTCFSFFLHQCLTVIILLPSHYHPSSTPFFLPLLNMCFPLLPQITHNIGVTFHHSSFLHYHRWLTHTYCLTVLAKMTWWHDTSCKAIHQFCISWKQNSQTLVALFRTLVQDYVKIHFYWTIIDPTLLFLPLYFNLILTSYKACISFYQLVRLSNRFLFVFPLILNQNPELKGFKKKKQQQTNQKWINCEVYNKRIVSRICVLTSDTTDSFHKVILAAITGRQAMISLK